MQLRSSMYTMTDATPSPDELRAIIPVGRQGCIDRPSIPAEFNVRNGATLLEHCLTDVAASGVRFAVIAALDGPFDPYYFGVLLGHIMTGRQQASLAGLDVWVEVIETGADTIDSVVAHQVATAPDAPWLLAAPLAVPTAKDSCAAVVKHFRQTGGAHGVIATTEADWIDALQHCKLSVADGRVTGVCESPAAERDVVFAGRAVIRPGTFRDSADLAPFCPGAFDYEGVIDRIVASEGGAVARALPDPVTDCRFLPIAC